MQRNVRLLLMSSDHANQKGKKRKEQRKTTKKKENRIEGNTKDNKRKKIKTKVCTFPLINVVY